MNALILTMLAMNCHQPETLPPPLMDVAPLLRDLGGDYKARTAAFAKLRAMGEGVRPALQRASNDTDLEVSRRAQSLLHNLNQERRRRAVKMIDAAFSEPLPWIDLAYIAPFDDLARTALEPYYFAAIDGPEPRDGCDACWGRYRTATRTLCIDLAEAGIPMWAIRSLVAELAAREETWYRNWRKSQGQQESIP